MKITHKRERFQQGSLTIEERKNGPSVWVFRLREKTGRKTVKRKIVLGTVKELNKTQAQKAADLCRQQASAPQTAQASDLTVAELVNHYKERELGDDSGKAAKPRKAYLYIFKNYILPKWGTFLLRDVRV